MKKKCRYKYLVIDDKDILEMSHLRRKVNSATKHPEPVLKMDAPWNGDNEQFNHCNVLYDAQEKCFKMWYSVSGKSDEDDVGIIVSTPAKIAYATSVDGIHWERPHLGLIEVNGSRDNNYVIPEMGFYGFTLIKDPSDLPERQYKMIFGLVGTEDRWAGFHIPLSLAYSADGIHWNCPRHVNPVLRGISDGCFSLYYDSDRRKYILLTRRVPNLPRDISQYESYDLVNWEDKGRVIVAGDKRDPQEMYNIYYMSPFRYGDLYLGLINTMYTLATSESYESFNKSPNYPNETLGHLDIQLAYTRDGKTWTRPDDRSVIVPYGKPGELDDGAIYPAENPIVHNGETWIYYTANRLLHCWWHEWELEKKIKQRDMACCMLAKMPEDGWVSLDANEQEGFFVCKPWGPPHEIFVNADAADGAIEVELITPYGQSVPQYSRSDCVAITANGKNQPIRWKHGQSPWETIAKNHLGGLLVKFYLKNAKLYSYTFTLLDPNGQLELDRINARWCETITHRSDNWDQNSTEPAIGVAPLGKQY